MKLDNTNINALSKADLDQYHVVHCFKGRDPFSDPFSSPKKKIFPVLILFAGKIFLSFPVNPRSEFLRNPWEQLDLFCASYCIISLGINSTFGSWNIEKISTLL